MKKVRIGVIGAGKIMMEWAHMPQYRDLADICEITAICDIDKEKLASAGDELGIPMDRRFTDYKEIIACEDVDAVDITTWNSVHCEIAMEAVRAGKIFSVEKPVGMNYREVKELYEASNEAGVENFVCLSWRYRKYPRYLKYLIDNGKLGKLYHIYVRCIKDSGLWEGRKREWRFDSSRAGSGVLCDLGSHMIDMIHFWGEEFCEVFANSGIFIKERPSEETGEMTTVDTDDWCNITAKLKSEASCTIQLSRCATTVPDIVEFELYGEKGKMVFSHIRGKQSLEFTDAKTKEKEIIEVPEKFDAVQSRSFVDLAGGIEDEYTAKLSHGLQCQAVIDAALISTKENRVVTIKEIIE